MSRDQSIAIAQDMFDSGVFLERLAQRIAIRTESQVPERAGELRRYLDEGVAPDLKRLGFDVEIMDDPSGRGGPFMIARRIEDPSFPALLTYGHGDVVRGMEGDWDKGRSPCVLDVEGDKFFGRGAVDNKGQHTLNLIALKAVIKSRGALGYNVTLILETSEEAGSPGIKQVVAENRNLLVTDVFIASDGPRLRADRPTLYLGARGAVAFDLRVRYRDGGQHSGTWGGLLANPGVRLANAIVALIDERGRVRVEELTPGAIPASIRAALTDCPVDSGEDGPAIDDWWGNERLTRAEKVYGWNSFDVLAFKCGHPDASVNAVPHEAFARCQIRHPVDRRAETFVPAIRGRLQRAGYEDVQVVEIDNTAEWGATRMDPASPWPVYIAESIAKSVGKTAKVPNFGGSCPNDSFAETLRLPTIYVSHSYPGCSQHAPNEHGLLSVFREGAAIMAGLFDDLTCKPWVKDGLPTVGASA